MGRGNLPPVSGFQGLTPSQTISVLPKMRVPRPNLLGREAPHPSRFRQSVFLPEMRVPRPNLLGREAPYPSRFRQSVFLPEMRVAGGPVKVFNSDSPSMRCAPSKLRLLRLGWGSTSVCPLSSVLPQATGSRAGTRSTAIRSPPCPSRRTRSAGSSTTASLLASQPVRAPPDCDEYTESLRSAPSLRERCCRSSGPARTSRAVRAACAKLPA